MEIIRNSVGAANRDSSSVRAQPPMKGRISENVAWNYANSIFVIGLGLLITPYILSNLGVEAYGVMMLQASLVSMATLANVSLVKAAVVNGGRTVSDRKTITLFSRITGWSECGLGLVAAYIILPLFSVPPELLLEARWLLIIQCIGQSLSVFIVLAQARLMMVQRFDLLNKALMAGQVVQCLCIVVVFELFRPSLLLYGGAVFFGAFVSRILIWCYARHHEGGPPIDPVAGKACDLRQFGSLWAAVAGQQICAVFSIQALQIGANLFGGPVANAVVGLLYTLRGAIGRLNDGIASAVFAALPQVYPHDELGTRRLWIRATRSVALLGMPFVLAFLLMPESIAEIWLGAKGGVVAEYLPLVALDVAVPTLGLITVQLLQLSKLRNALFMIDLLLLITIVASVIVAGYLEIATPGNLFFAYAILRSGYGIFLVLFLGARAAFAERPAVLKEIFGPVMICSVPAAIVIWLAQRLVAGVSPVYGLLACVGAAAFVYLPLVWSFGLDSTWRSSVKERLARLG